MKPSLRLGLAVAGAAILVAMTLAFQATENIKSIRLQRTACYGTCPSYEVTLSADGTVSYHGDAFVKRIGRYQARIKPAEFRKLAAKVVALGFYQMQDRYFEEVTDMPSQTLTVGATAGSKSVYCYGSRGPESLCQLHDLVDKTLSQATNWRRLPGSASQQP